MIKKILHILTVFLFAFLVLIIPNTFKTNTIKPKYISDSSQIDSLQYVIFELSIENGQYQILLDNYRCYCKKHHIDAPKIEANME